MDEVIFSGFGAEIILRSGRFYIRCDVGEIVTSIEEYEITEAESHKAQKSERDAYEVILASQKRLR